jgi:hypothetical protein
MEHRLVGVIRPSIQLQEQGLVNAHPTRPEVILDSQPQARYVCVATTL